MIQAIRRKRLHKAQKPRSPTPHDAVQRAERHKRDLPGILRHLSRFRFLHLHTPYVRREAAREGSPMNVTSACFLESGKASVWKE